MAALTTTTVSDRVWTVLTDAGIPAAIDDHAVILDAMSGAESDAFAYINPHDLVAVSGTWTPSYASNVPINTLTASASAVVGTFGIDAVAREAASRGLRIDTVDMWYSVNTEDADDVTLELIEFTGTADGTIPTAAVLGGDADEDYDAAHDTAAERGDDTGAPEEHKLTMTPTGAAVYQGAENGMCLRLTVDGGVGVGTVFILQGIIINFTRNFSDVV